MRRRRNEWLIRLLVFVVIVGGTLAVRYLPGVVPYWQCSEVYKQCSKLDGVRATFVKDYPVNDTLEVSVTLLEATTDSGWVLLQEKFGVPIIPKEYERYFLKDSNKLSVKHYPKNVPLCSGGDTIKNDLITISRYKRTICYFEIDNPRQRRAIVYKQFDDMVNDSLTY